ncbi:ABC transporter permease [Peptoniphilus gorbachii]|uniref:Spermidine/putrescine transport system permease protein n=1 Tax=Peptoniphilus gorbachii TaxID=411567 RepID=A0ABS2MLT8_9FIRM|nr:ABC transporter permease [Peptoniphilus gorbachii]MDU1663602.1 ABC transporter permease [Peptoniphilus harei]MBM7550989.1 spermidine/putrescine transport system permease protein [Peptoniphilus gorbachii]MDU4046337.1 ABC transporter permease [Peptoniphilus harei]MDU5570989.1 ABC transporter permease [Peptoniphilus harei]MDU7115348.1 ABC transporter permease [Peptoniphilus harei]
MKKFSLIYLFWGLIFIVLPLFLILAHALSSNTDLSEFAFTLDNFSRFFEPLYVKILITSLILAGLSTILCLIVGYPVAYIISKMSEKVRNNMILIFIIPMWMNFLLRTYAWLTLLGNKGLINKFIGLFGLGPWDLMYNSKAIMIGMVYNFLPFMVLPIYTVLLKMDQKLIEAAKDLGANDFEVFTKVIFPLSLPGIYTGITMVFIPAISTFVVPNLLGGNNFYLIGNLIEKQFTFTGDWGFGSAISMILIVIMLLILVVPKLFNKKIKTGDLGGDIF